MSAKLRRYISLHAGDLAGALRRLAGQPVATLMTVLVIAIALALPAGLRVFVGNLDAIGGSWQGAADFSVYLAPEVNEEDARRLTETIEGRADVADARLITRADALAQFRARSGFGDALDALGHNPLPHTIVVSPTHGAAGDPETVARSLGEEPSVDFVQLDTDWVARLKAILALASRVVDVATAVLGLGVVLVIGNTIRLEINHRAVEIEVVKLVGGTDAFIRRPFLYLGLCYGLVGAVLAALLVEGSLLMLDGPASTLAELYRSDFRLAGLRSTEAGVLVGGGAVLGLAGAALATARHLRAIEPS